MSIPGFPGVPPRMEVTGDLRNILRACTMAVDMELLGKPAPASSVRNPDGSQQSETQAERSRRIVETAVMYAVENGLLSVPGDIAGRLDDCLPAQRA